MINKVILMGRLTADPELKQTTSGVAVCSFNVAVTRSYKDSNGNYPADFVRVQSWRGTAEFVNRYFSKGKMIIVEGNLQNNDYTDKNNVKHYQMIVVAEAVHFGETKGTATSAENAQVADTSADVGDLSDFTEILSDGEVPF